MSHLSDKSAHILNRLVNVAHAFLLLIIKRFFFVVSAFRLRIVLNIVISPLFSARHTISIWAYGNSTSQLFVANHRVIYFN
jgi:hypothetical protein